MLLSVIIPTCKRNDLLSLCLDRLASGAQSLDAMDYEVIVSDDGSNNEAKTVIGLNYPWASWVEGPKKGPAANRNNGAKYAKGDWLLFLDDDCLPSETLLKNYLSTISEHPDYQVFEGVIMSEGELPNALMYAPIKMEAGALWSCNFCISSSLFRKVDGFDEGFLYAHMEDKDLQLRLTEKGNKILFVDNAIVIHPWRQLPNGFELAKRESMMIYFNLKHGIPLSRILYLRKLFNFYTSRIIKRFTLSSSIILSIHFMQHTVFFLLKYPSWYRKYHALLNH